MRIRVSSDATPRIATPGARTASACADYTRATPILPEPPTMKSSPGRRRFLEQAGLAGAGLAASSIFSLPSYSQKGGRTAKVSLGLVTPRENFNRRLFG